MHILARTLESAQNVLAAAQEAGFRESGISSISAVDQDNLQQTMIAVRTHGLSFDNFVGCLHSKQTITPLVPSSTIQLLVHDANQKFAENTARTRRFRDAVHKRFNPPPSYGDHGLWETPETRRARMRAEGLQRQAEGRKNRPTHNHDSGTTDDVQPLYLEPIENDQNYYPPSYAKILLQTLPYCHKLVILTAILVVLRKDHCRDTSHTKMTSMTTGQYNYDAS